MLVLYVSYFSTGTYFTSILSVLIWVQAVCKGHQRMTKVSNSKDRALKRSNMVPSDNMKAFSLECVPKNNNFLIPLFVWLILYVPSIIFQLNRDGSSWVEPVLS